MESRRTPTTDGRKTVNVLIKHVVFITSFPLANETMVSISGKVGLTKRF